MQRLWLRDGPITVREMLDELGTTRPVAYTTVMTVLDNLHRKRMVDRTMAGRAWRYHPRLTRTEYTAELIEGVLADTDDRTAALVHFTDRLTPEEIAALRRALTPAKSGSR